MNQDTPDSTLDRVLRCVRQEFSFIVPITADTSFSEELHLDDLDLTELGMAIEKEFGVEISDEHFGQIDTPLAYAQALDRGAFTTVWRSSPPEPPPSIPAPAPPSSATPTSDQLAQARLLVDQAFETWKASVGGTELRPILAEAFAKALAERVEGTAVSPAETPPQELARASRELLDALRADPTVIPGRSPRLCGMRIALEVALRRHTVHVAQEEKFARVVQELVRRLRTATAEPFSAGGPYVQGACAGLEDALRTHGTEALPRSAGSEFDPDYDL